MSQLDCTTTTPQVIPAVSLLFVHPVVAAQRAGDADYAAVLHVTGDGELAARAYHVAYQRLARVPGGCGPVCGCDLCRDEFGVKGGAL